MEKRIKKFRDRSGVEFLLLRERLGIGRFRKTRKRESDKRGVLLKLGLKRMEDKEKDDFIPLGHRRKRVKVIPRS